MMRDRNHLRDLAARFETYLEQEGAEQMATRAMARAAGLPRLRSRLVLAASSGIAIAAIGASGLGVAANSAVPGEFLYSVDRAYESVGSIFGFDGGKGEERVLEAIALIDRGDESGAIDALSEALIAIEHETGVTGISRTLSTIAQPEFAVPPELKRPETAAVDDASSPEELAPVAALVPGESPLKIAAQLLLRSLKAAPDELTAAVDQVEAAALALGSPATAATTTTSTTSTVVAGDRPTTTIAPGDESTTTTTTTTGDTGSTTTTTVPDDGGPIILPPQP